MDNLFVGNLENVTGVSDTQGITIMSHWLEAAANLVIGSDLTQLDALGLELLTSSQSAAVAQFSAQYPMQPRNPGSGNNLAQQLQAWIAGPDEKNESYLRLANYGPDQGAGGSGTSLTGRQAVTVSLSDLGISSRNWTLTNVWSRNTTEVSRSFTTYLDEGESQLLRLNA
jgi:alpha-galactosidase